MPIYEYRCEQCAHEYEMREGFDASAVKKCPSCGGKARRVLQAAPIVFKGSGFYVTDSRKASPSDDSEASSTSTDTKKTSDAKISEDSSGKDTEAAAAS